MGFVALCLGVLNQAATDIAIHRSRGQVRSGTMRTRASQKSDVSRTGLIATWAADAEAFLSSADARNVCDVLAIASYGKVKLSPEWIRTRHVARLMSQHAHLRAANINHWLGKIRERDMKGGHAFCDS
jgi:hypothetical protein